MKKIFTIMALVAAASTGVAQSRAIDRHANMLMEGRPFFTDAAHYNSYHLGGSPVGLFDIGSGRLSAEARYGYYGLGDETGHYLSGQTVRMGQPDRSYFELFYGPDILSHKNTGNDANAASLTLHRFGLTMATQTTDGFFRSALSAEGYIGGQEWERGDDRRAQMGFERIRLDMGSQVHPYLRVAFFFNLTLHLDTLYTPNNVQEDRSSQMNLPEFGGNIDIGAPEIPVRANLSVTCALSRFVYTYKGAAAGHPPVDPRGNANPIMNDSLRITLLAQGTFGINDDFTLMPGLLIGYYGLNGEMRVPHVENAPLQPGDPISGTAYSLSGIYLGAGTGFRAAGYADLHAEYVGAMMSLNSGSVYGPPLVKSRTLHQMSFGVSTPLHEYLEIPLNITPRIAYFISGSAGVVSPVHSGVDPLNIVPGRSKGARYMPQTFLSGFRRTSGFTFGIDGAALEEQLSAAFWMTFLSKSGMDRGGMELGLSVGYSI
jgi:hypothetical protein